MPPAPTNSTSAAPKQVLTPAKKGTQHHEAPRDTTREIFETIVFVIVLVLMLKLFVAEAFVIPTGSMASTLWGDQVRCTCRECLHQFPINASNGGERMNIDHYLCENCGYVSQKGEAREDFTKSFFSNDPVSSGDRVLVSKYAYHFDNPKRFDVPVFKYPKEPYSAREKQGMNYIKRLVGLGGETVAVFNGDLYTSRTFTYDHIPAAEKPQRDVDAWWPRYMYPNDEAAIAAFRDPTKNTFEIVRKSPKEIMAMRRIVFDLDQQPKSLQGVGRLRWQIDDNQGAGWNLAQTETDKSFQHVGNDEGFVLYQHIDPWSPVFRQDPPSQQPFKQKQYNADKSAKDPRHYIVDFIGYNIRDTIPLFMPIESNIQEHWVSDLILDCTIDIPSADSQVTLELAKGRDRFQAVFAKGECKLVRITANAGGRDEVVEMGRQPTKITTGGQYALRFANVDCRLTVWVDKKAISFAAEQSDYKPPTGAHAFEPYPDNDLLQPARIGARGDAKVSHVSLWRDLLYRSGWPSLPDAPPAARDQEQKSIDDLRKGMLLEWKHIPSNNGSDVQTYYVQPGHFLMFGDNVNSSADSRSWGTVPARLMLGRAVVVYWPVSRMGVIE